MLDLSRLRRLKPWMNPHCLRRSPCIVYVDLPSKEGCRACLFGEPRDDVLFTTNGYFHLYLEANLVTSRCRIASLSYRYVLLFSEVADHMFRQAHSMIDDFLRASFKLLQ